MRVQDSTFKRIVLSLSREDAMGPSADLCWGRLGCLGILMCSSHSHL